MNQGTATFVRIVLLLSAAVFAWFGVLTLWSPARMAAMVDFGLLSPTASVELRAMYGGLEIGIAAFFVLCALQPPLFLAGCWASFLMLAGLGAGRLAGLLLAPGARRVMWIALAVEVVGAVVAAVAVMKLTAHR